MQPRLGTRRRQHARQSQLSHAVLPSPPTPSCPWRLTRRLTTAGRLTLFRAAAANELGPGCYVLRTAATADDTIARAMLQREHLVSSEVSHARLNSVLVADFAAPHPVLILPYLEGISLRRLIASSSTAPRRLPTAFILLFVRQIAEALVAMHAAGWLHGQVLPEHIIVSPHAHATLIDLTLARRLGTDECDASQIPNVTTDNRCAMYAAPESFSSRHRLTTAADVYSLGILLFELLAGDPPFPAKSSRELAICHQRQAPPNLRQMRPGLSHDVAELVRRMLAKEPLRRPSDDQLIRWLAELEIAELAL
jgi:serine/threonine protein kinase